MSPDADAHDDLRGPLAWMTRHKVAANLLMICLLAGGLFMGYRIKQEVFPSFDLDVVNVVVPYPGASPEEVEQGVILAIEEAVRGLDGVEEVTSTAAEGAGTVTVELLLGADTGKALQDVQNAVDRITTFPEDAEEPRISLATRRHEVISIVLYGEHDARTLKRMADRVRDDLLQLPEITLVELSGVRPLEIAVEIPPDTLRAYGLTLGDVAALLRRKAIEVPGGAVKTRGGEVLLRMKERRDWGLEFARLPVVTRPDGTYVRLGEIASVRDTFEETDEEILFNGSPAVVVDVYRVGEQTPLEVAAAVKAYAETLRRRLPAGMDAALWNDRSEIYAQRIDLLMRNAYIGLVLVMLLLGLFLEVRLAFWVTLGIPVSFLGAFFVLPLLDVTLNMISLFAFIMSLGMVVDDAIVVGENIFRHRQTGSSFLRAAVEGTREVAVPVTYSILTNVAAFSPMLFVPGFLGKIFRVIPLVVITVFLVSLVEALFILPAHLGHGTPTPKHGLRALLKRLVGRVGAGLEWVIATLYRPFLETALRYRYLTVSIGLAVLIVTLAAVKSGRVRVLAFPKVESDFALVGVELPYGAPPAETKAVLRRLRTAAMKVIAERGGESILEGLYMHLGRQFGHRDSGASGGHVGTVLLMLVPMDERDASTRAIVDAWREEVGTIPGVESISFQADFGGPRGGSAVDVRLSHGDLGVLETAAADLARQLRNFEGVTDIDDGFTPGKPQFDFHVRPEAQSLGLTAAEAGRQIRNAYYGAEAFRQQRGRDEITVVVRYPEADRHTLHSLESMILRTPDGGEIPLSEAVRIERGRAYTSIGRADGRRVVHVTADMTDPSKAGQVLEALEAEALPALLARYPGLRYDFKGQQEDLEESFTALGEGFLLAMLVIYAMLAIPFRSYVQPVIIMTSIPFGIVGAVLGHVMMGYHLSIISMMGIVALSGVVVNDSLVLIDFANTMHRNGTPPFEAVLNAGQRRFRPILLTSLTTFGGLAPMIFETSMQARFLIPMALSLGYGILFATAIALVLVPCLYVIVEDVSLGAARVHAWLFPPPPEPAASATPAAE